MTPPRIRFRKIHNMSIESLKSSIPDFAKDVRLNLSSMANDETLTPSQKYGLFVACAVSARNSTVAQALEQEALANVSETVVNAAKSAASIMAMNNIYYRFTHLVSAQDYKGMPAKLRMSVIANPGVDKVDFELWSVAISAINGCGMCMDSHEAVLRKAGVSVDVIQTAIRFAAIIQSAAVAVEAASIELASV